MWLSSCFPEITLILVLISHFDNAYFIDKESSEMLYNRWHRVIILPWELKGDLLAQCQEHNHYSVKVS